MEEIVHPKGKIYYSMGEVCDMFGVNASLLRFWESEFPILKIAKNSRGHRIYTTADVDNLRTIYHLVKEQGLTLEGAKKRLRQNRDGVSHDAEVIERLRSVRNMLAALKAELGDDVEVIEIDDEAAEEYVAPASHHQVCAPTEEYNPTEQQNTTEQQPLATAKEAVEEVVEEPAVAVEEPRKEQLADFKMEMPSGEPQEEPKKSAPSQKMGTLIGGDLFFPEVKIAEAKRKSKEAKKQVIEQTLF